MYIIIIIIIIIIAADVDARRKEFVRPSAFILDSRGSHVLVILASEHKVCASGTMVVYAP